MKTILQALSQIGFDPEQITLSGTLQHLRAGSADHWRGGQVEKMKPMLTTLRFMHPQQVEPIMVFSNAASRLDNEDVYWESLQVPGVVDTQEARRLITEMLSSHRLLTGALHSTYDMIEIDEALIAAQIKKKETLSVELMRLVNYIDLDDQLLDLLIEESSPEKDVIMGRLMFERFSLTETFQKQPCTAELYLGLLKERIASECTAVDLRQYYEWFRKSETLFDKNGQIAPDSKAKFANVVKAWGSAGAEPTREWIEEKQYWARRNFGVHPRHEDQFNALVEKVALECAGAAQVSSDAPSLKPSAKTNGVKP